MFTSLLSWVPFSVTGRYSMWYPVMLPLGSRGGVHDNSTLVDDRVNPLIECTCPGTGEREQVNNNKCYNVQKSFWLTQACTI